MKYVIPLILLCLAAAPAPKEKHPTFAELREMVQQLRKEVESLKKEVAELKARVPKASTRLFTDGPEVGMTEDELEKMLGPNGDYGGVESNEQFLRDGKKVKRTTYRVKFDGDAFEKMVVVENGVVISVNG